MEEGGGLTLEKKKKLKKQTNKDFVFAVWKKRYTNP